MDDYVRELALSSGLAKDGGVAPVLCRDFRGRRVCMAAIWAAGIGAASGIVGDVMSSQGQSATNAQNLAIDMGNNEFNAGEASKNRAFQADQAVKARSWETEMSDTAMQRRVADLKASGLNPMLAIGQGGASTPNSPAMSGATASAGPTSPMQNPGQSYAQLGNQVTNAIQSSTVASQIDKNKADAAASLASAKKDASQTYDPGKFNAMVDNQMAGVTANANQANQNVENLKKQMSEIDARIGLIEQQTKGQQISNSYLPQLNDLSMALTRVQTQLAALQVPKQQVEAGLASSAKSVFDAVPAMQQKAAGAVADTLSDLDDWVSSSQAAVRGFFKQMFSTGGRNSMQPGGPSAIP